jgi:phospholipid transport system transporter-binding protein
MTKSRALIEKTKNFNWSDSVQIDLSQVKHVDTSALSLIFEFKRNAKRNNQIVTINTPPKNLLKLAKLYGVEDLI